MLESLRLREGDSRELHNNLYLLCRNLVGDSTSISLRSMGNSRSTFSISLSLDWSLNSSETLNSEEASSVAGPIRHTLAFEDRHGSLQILASWPSTITHTRCSFKRYSQLGSLSNHVSTKMELELEGSIDLVYTFL